MATTVVIDRSSVSSTDSLLSNVDEKNEVIDYISIADKINDTGKILTFLKSYVPEKTKTRSTKKPTPSTEIPVSTLVELFGNMQTINRQLLANMEKLSKENEVMKTQIESLIGNKRSYASAVTASQAVTLATPLTGAAASVVEPACNKATSDLKSINAEIDKIKQEALSNILLLQWYAVNGRIAESSDTDAAKDVLRSTLQPVTVVKMEDIVHVSIQGKERKLFNVAYVYKEARTSLLRNIKKKT